MSTKAVKQVSQKVVVPMINDACRRGAMKFSVKMVFMMFVVGLLAAGMVGANATETVNYDTAWTFVYDGGKYKDVFGETVPIPNNFKDVKVLPNGEAICVGKTLDSSGIANILLTKINANGTLLWKRLYERSEGGALCISKNGDYVIGGNRYGAPLIIKTDTVGNIKWTTWYYDSINDKIMLFKSATVNSIRETSKGRIVCATGDEFPSNNGYSLNNYAAYLELDLFGKIVQVGQWDDEVGYNIAGFSIEELNNGDLIIAGNQAISCFDTSTKVIWENTYTFSLTGVGTKTNNITRAKKLRDGTLMVIGQAYEGNCWTNYQRLYYDAWWSPLSSGGSNDAWDTAGVQGANDKIYDFTQLVNGNLVFIGVKGGGTGNLPVWLFATDSTVKNILWEKQFAIQKSKRVSMLPLSVTSTPDSGFTVVGDGVFDTLTGHNAFAMHFVQKPPTAIMNENKFDISSAFVTIKNVGSKVRFTFKNKIGGHIEVNVFDLLGKNVARLTSTNKNPCGQIQWDRTGVAKGLYFYRVRVNGAVAFGKIGL
jgi:hypothetical protein